MKTAQPTAPAAGHTPLPWYVKTFDPAGPGKQRLVAVYSSPQNRIADCRKFNLHKPVSAYPEEVANAALIVRAVNSHAELLAALLHARNLVASRDVTLDRAALRMYDEALCAASPAIAEQLYRRDGNATAHGFIARAAIGKAKGTL